jgi:hypothetical protein
VSDAVYRPKDLDGRRVLALVLWLTLALILQDLANAWVVWL